MKKLSDEGALTEWLLRVFAVLAYAFAVSNLAHAWRIDHSRWTLLILLLTEGYTLMLVLVARRASERDTSLIAMVATTYALFYYALLDPIGTTRLIPEWGGVVLQMVGTLWQFASKVTLGRSFGLLPAQRGLVMSGPYRVVRHPIYLGYFVAHVGFLLVNFSWQNVAVSVVLYGAQVTRLMREEAVLSNAQPYRDYQRAVRWRLIPYVF